MNAIAFRAPFFGPQPIRMWDGTDAFRRMVTDPAWVVEAKKDDWRCFVQWTKGGLVSWSNTGRPLALPPITRAAFVALALPAGTAIDGCLIGKRGGTPGYLAFDLALWAGAPLVDGLDSRRTRLIDAGLPVVERLPNEEASFTAALGMDNVEGIVLKRRAARYTFARSRRQETADWIKVKRAARFDEVTHRVKVKG